jgi:hypothetical protein
VRRGLTLAATQAAVEVSRGIARARLAPGRAGATARAAAAFATNTDAAPGGVSPQIVTLAREGIQGMFPSKLKATVVLLVAVGLTGTGLGWQAGGPATPATVTAAAPDGPVLAARDDMPAARQPRRQDNAREDLQRMVKVAAELDKYYSIKIVEARQRLVELEEQLREVQAEPVPAPDSAWESKERGLRREEENITAQFERAKQQLAPNAPPTALDRYQAALDVVRKELKDAAERKDRARVARSRQVIELRKQMVRLEEDIRLLERERASRWEDSERRREAAAERVQVLEGGAPADDAPAQRATLRKLDALQREIAELRRELQRQRSDKKP